MSDIVIRQEDINEYSVVIDETDHFELHLIDIEKRVRVQEQAGGAQIGMFLNFFILNKEYGVIETYGAVESYMRHMLKVMQEHVDKIAAEKAEKEAENEGKIVGINNNIKH